MVAQRFSTDGIWCAPKETAIPTIFAPGRVFAPSDDDSERWEELDYEAVIDAVLNDGGTVKVDLLLTPVPPLKQETIDDGLESKIIKPQDFAKVGLVSAVRTPTGVSVFRSDVGDPPSYEGHLDPDGRLIASPHGRFQFKTEFESMELENVLEHADAFMLRDFKHLLRRLWKDIIELYIHYSEVAFDEAAYQRTKKSGFGKKKKGDEKEEEFPEEPPVLTLRKFALFCRTCRLTSTTFTFHRLLVTSLPRVFATGKDDNDELHWNVNLSPGNFMEALVRIAVFKCGGLYGIAERVNTLIHSTVFPYATADDRDSDEARIRDVLGTPAVMSCASTTHLKTLWKLYKLFLKPHAPPSQPRTATIRRIYLMFKQYDQFAEEQFQPADLLRCFTSAILCTSSSSQAISLDDDSIELSFYEFVEVGAAPCNHFVFYLICALKFCIAFLLFLNALVPHVSSNAAYPRDCFVRASLCLQNRAMNPGLKPNATKWSNDSCALR